MDAQEKEKKLKLMRFWLFGAFVIFFAAITVYFGALGEAVGLVIDSSSSIFTNIYYWILMAVIAVACVGVWFFYKWYLDRK